MKIYVLVYQGGIANVFLCEEAPYEPIRHNRVLQSDFHTCESFCRGLMEAGVQVMVAWCNQAGDIASEPWNYGAFDEAPFNDKFALIPR